jgi:transposase InsO family protein
MPFMAILLRCRAGFHPPTGQVADQNRQLPSPLCRQARPCHPPRLHSVVHFDARIPSGPEPAKLSGPPEVYRSTRNALQRFQKQKVETLFGSLKVERLHGMRFETRRQAKDEVVDWLTFYSRKRMHSTLGYTSPMAFEENWRRQQETLAA